jgi:hypothetical protein
MYAHMGIRTFIILNVWLLIAVLDCLGLDHLRYPNVQNGGTVHVLRRTASRALGGFSRNTALCQLTCLSDRVGKIRHQLPFRLWSTFSRVQHAHILRPIHPVHLS